MNNSMDYIKNNIILFAVFTLLLSNKIENIPIQIKQPDGQLFECLISGDEYYQRLHDSKNFTIIIFQCRIKMVFMS